MMVLFLGRSLCLTLLMEWWARRSCRRCLMRSTRTIQSEWLCEWWCAARQVTWYRGRSHDADNYSVMQNCNTHWLTDWLTECVTEWLTPWVTEWVSLSDMEVKKSGLCTLALDVGHNPTFSMECLVLFYSAQEDGVSCSFQFEVVSVCLIPMCLGLPLVVCSRVCTLETWCDYFYTVYVKDTWFYRA